jgi:hypothetical protein
MNFVINDSQLFLLLDSVFPDLSVKKIRSQNPTYAIESNDNEMFHYENGCVNVNPDFIEMINEFAPIKITKDVVVTIGKWIHSRTGLKPRLIWIGLKNYNVEPHLNESFDKLRARRFMHIANDYFNNLSPKDVCDYWKSEEVDDYVTETVAEMVRFITDEYPDVSAEDWHETYDGIYQMLDSIGYSDNVRDFFYDSLDNCSLNESEEEYEDNDDALAKVIGAYLNRNEYEGVNSIWVDYNVLFDSFDINIFLDKQYVVDLKSRWPSHWNSLRYEITDDSKSFFPDFKFSCYHHFGKGINESEDKPMKKFNRDSNPNPGKYGKMIEKIALSYFRNPDDVCDLICIKTTPNQTGLGEYILLVLMSYSMTETKLTEYIKNFVPVDLMVMINTNYHCKDED